MLKTFCVVISILIAVGLASGVRAASPGGATGGGAQSSSLTYALDGALLGYGLPASAAGAAVSSEYSIEAGDFFARQEYDGSYNANDPVWRLYSFIPLPANPIMLCEARPVAPAPEVTP